MNQINLFRAMNAYLVVMFIVGLAQSMQFYLGFISLVKKAPNRWPRLVRLAGRHIFCLVTPGLIWPLSASLFLMVVQCVASIYIWPSADEFVLGQTNIVFVSLLLPVGIAMVGLDLFRILQGTTLDSKAVEPFLNLAEGALHPGTVVVGKAVSLGRFNPVAIVSIEVKKHLLIIDEALKYSLWLITSSLVLRGIFASILWLAFINQ